MNTYKVLSKQNYSIGDYSIVPIRMIDRFDIMKWRNEQIYHLRQNQLLTKQDQDKYFNSVVSELFMQERPNQILFSYLEGEKCIGYGGLVHINWIDYNAEISFIMDTTLEEDSFELNWKTYLALIEKVAFDELSFHKLYIYAFDLRPQLYKVMDNNNYFRDATLKDHCFYQGNFIDVVIYSKLIN